MRFDGADYVPERDDVRLTGQQARIWDLMCDGKWRTLQQISQVTGDPEASVSAQLRHFRKPRFGAHTIEREYVNRGLYLYRLIINEEQQ
jgi:hypothetical protein